MPNDRKFLSFGPTVVSCMRGNIVKPFVRGGRRLPIPSTVQIKHELRAFSAEEDVREECAVREGLSANADWDAIYAHRKTAAA